MKKFLLCAIIGFQFLPSFSQNEKKPLTHDVYDSWNDVVKTSISQNGQYIYYEINPQDGDGVLKLFDNSTNKNIDFVRGYNASISPLSDFFVCHIKPLKSVTRKAKLDKKSKDEMPKDSAIVFVVSNEKKYQFSKIRSYKLGETGGGWVALFLDQQKQEEVKKDSTKKEDSKKEKTKKKPTKEGGKEKPGELILLNPSVDKTITIKNVTDYSVSKNGSLFAVVSKTTDTLANSVIRLFSDDTIKIFEQKGEVSQLTFDETGNQFTFLFTADTGKVKVYDLYYWNSRAKSIQKLITRESVGMPKGWVVSQHTKPYFSNDGTKLYLATMPQPIEEPKDTLTEDEKVILDIWSWTDTLLQTQQKIKLKDEEKRSYLAVYHIKENKLIQLANKNLEDVRIENKGDAPYALGENDKPYRYSMTWESPSNSDYYHIDLKTGVSKLIIKANPFRVSLSPSGLFATYFEPSDNAWYAWSQKDNRSVKISSGIEFNLFDEKNDMPLIPNPYGFAGWVEGDKYFIIYDMFDLWALDPTGKSKPICLTSGYGRKNKIMFRYQKIDNEQVYIPINSTQILRAFYEKDKSNGFYSFNITKPGEISELIKGDYIYQFAGKAKKSNQIIWQKESYKDYRDVWTSNIDFTGVKKISDANPQSKDFLWGSVQLVHWFDFNRDSVEGLLYLPDNFDPNKKYPMMVYFYETHTDGLNRHYEPKPGRSVIFPTYYTSNGYVVFFPDIKYREGLPGKSAYDAVISGTMAMISKGFIDRDRVGVQGQSWGGYQIAYLVTQTDLFKAASAGAPVVNMTSAYGGIRWESGLARMFQYEHTQSRIGASLWDRPLHYIENSPLFYAPRVNTPLLIRHDDADGAVPWYQGIEYFLALRRLGKQVWMINYNDEPHNLVRRANRIDWAIRMQQFFDHYLKDSPMPAWMKEGIPAIKKGKTLGYELE